MKWEEAKLKADNQTWADLELRPTGKIETKEQYDYVMYYGNHTPIDVGERYMKSFEESKGKYLHLGSWLVEQVFITIVLMNQNILMVILKKMLLFMKNLVMVSLEK